MPALQQRRNWLTTFRRLAGVRSVAPRRLARPVRLCRSATFWSLPATRFSARANPKRMARPFNLTVSNHNRPLIFSMRGLFLVLLASVSAGPKKSGAAATKSSTFQRHSSRDWPATAPEL
uniref:Uncharacterized protein n=1 Tax=Burkholderia sp. M701 TaxID=326454 RepID=V5YNA6_9BURK|nr:hypothetical protein [Burkholderia sp. M701]